MIRFAARRVAEIVPILAASSIMVFAVIRMLPGNPAEIYAGPDATPAVIAAVRQRFGLDRSLIKQYGIWISDMVRGNLGTSYISHQPVRDLIGSAIPNTFELALAAIMFSVVAGMTLGLWSGLHHGGWPDKFVAGYNAVCLGVPNFWLGFLLLLVFAVQLNIFPTGGEASLFSTPWSALRSLVLPTVALGARFSAVVARFTRHAVLEALGEDYVRTGLAKGLSMRQLIWHDLLKNVSVPIIAITGVEFGGLLGGAVVIETVFSWPGLGQLLIQSLNNRDYLVLQALLLLFVTAFLLTSLLADVCTALIDPRVRAGMGRA